MSDRMPLSGVRVLDVTGSVAGPYCSLLLADMGAAVIKVEPPGAGDDARYWGPPFLNGESAWYLSLNRRKKSVTLDFTRPKGKELLLALARESDVFLTNLRPQVLERHGLTDEAVRAVNPGIVYCGLTGYGFTGPYRGRAAYDLIAEGMGGIMSVTGEAGGRPQKVGAPAADMSAGTYAAFAIVSSLYRKKTTGEGEFIDVSLLDGQIAFQTPRFVSFLISGDVPGRTGATDSVIAIYQAFRTLDGEITLGIGNDAIWKRFCEALDMPELAERAEYATNNKRRERREELVGILSPILSGKKTDELLDLLVRRSVPCGPIYTFDRVVNDPHVRERGTVTTIPMPGVGDVPQIASPWRFARSTGNPPAPPPRLGEHNREVLCELLGIPGEELADLAAEGIIGESAKQP